MRGIKNVEQKLRNDPKRLEAYEKYQKYKAMLEAYNGPEENGIEFVRNLASPFRHAGKFAEENDFNLEEYETFCDKVDKLKKDNSKVKLNDLTSRKGREVIAEVISESQNDRDFKPADLDSVAVAECYGLYKAIDETQGKSNTEIIKILKEYQVPIDIYQRACENVEDYKKNNRKELYDCIRKGESQDIVHTTAAALEIGPGEAESDLVSFEVIEGKSKLSQFDRELRVDHDYELYQADYDLIERAKQQIDIIIYDDRLTDKEKEALIGEKQALIERTEQKLENIKNKRAEKAHIVKSNVIKSLGDDDREIG